MRQSVQDAPALPTNQIYEAVASYVDPWQTPEWKVSGVFSSHMVIQRDRPVTVWGWSSHTGTEITATWGNEHTTASVSPEGRFEVSFAPRQASCEPTEMRIASAYGETVFTDILVGDVWIVGGQSNAELSLNPCLKHTPEIAESLDENLPIRLFTQTREGAIHCEAYHNVPARDVIDPNWQWRRPDPETAKAFSAIGYYFARLVNEQTGIPMGVIMTGAGGACLRELMPIPLGHRLGYTTGANVPLGGYYHTLVAPFEGLQFMGEIFFQGESEGIWPEMAETYDVDLAAFVADQRERFGVEFPFYNVQLSSYRHEGEEFFPHLQRVRVKQFNALSLIPDSYLAVSRDLGADADADDWAHSTHKFALARRIVKQALANHYGIGGIEEACAPVPCQVTLTGDTVTVKFAYTNGRLHTPDNADVTGFSFRGEGGEILPAAAEIVGEDEVSVTIPEGADPAKLHYCPTNIGDLSRANLLGGTDLPVPAFEVEIEG